MASAPFEVEVTCKGVNCVASVEIEVEVGVALASLETSQTISAKRTFGAAASALLIPQLANGVYLYRVIAKNADGKAFESFDSGTSDYFKKGIGKLVIIR